MVQCATPAAIKTAECAMVQCAVLNTDLHKKLSLGMGRHIVSSAVTHDQQVTKTQNYTLYSCFKGHLPIQYYSVTVLIKTSHKLVNLKTNCRSKQILCS